MSFVESTRTVCSFGTMYSFALYKPVAVVTVAYFNTKVENVEICKKTSDEWHCVCE